MKPTMLAILVTTVAVPVSYGMVLIACSTPIEKGTRSWASPKSRSGSWATLSGLDGFHGHETVSCSAGSVRSVGVAARLS